MEGYANNQSIPKAQSGGVPKKTKYGTISYVKAGPDQIVKVNGKPLSIKSDEYSDLSKKGIGYWTKLNKETNKWETLPNNLSSSAYENAQWIPNATSLPEVTVTAKMNPYMSAARKKAKEQAGALEAFRKQEEAGYPKWYKNSTLYNPEKDKETQEDHYNTWVNRSAYQNLVDNIPQKEDESRIDYINRFNNLAGKNAVSFAREANVTEPFDPSNLAKLGQWGWKGLNHIGAGTQALFTSNPTDFMSTIQRGINRGNQPTYGMLPDEAKEVGVFQPFETLDNLAYRYAFRPALKGYDNLADPKNKQARNFGSRYLGASDTDKMFTSLLNPLNYISGAEILSGGRNLVRGAEGLKGAYNTVAKGESFLPIAWKSPAVGLTQEASADMFKGIANADKLTDAERALLLEYQYDSKPFTGRTYGDGVPNIDQAKRQALNNVIKNNEVNFNNDAILTRKFNPDNKSLGAEFSNGRLNLGDRPTSFSAGVGNSSYGSGSVDRIVVPNRYSKNMGDKFLANEYGTPSDKTFDLLSGETKNFAAARGVMADDIINAERELIGTGLDFKRIGKVKNDIGGYDHIVKPNVNTSGSPKSFGLNMDGLKRLGRQLTDPFNPNNLKANNAQEWMSKWYSDPETLARMEAYKAKPSGNYLKNEVKNIKDFNFRDKFFNDPVINPIEDKNYIDLLKEKGLEKYLEHGTTSSGVSWGDPSSIYINRPSYFPFNKKGLESTKVHEATHAMESNGRMFNRKEIGDLIEPFGYTEETLRQLKPSGPFALKNPKYYADPTEIHARMNETRYRLGLKPGEEMTKDMYNSAYKFNKFNGMGTYIKDHNKMRNLFNKFYVAAPLAIGAGAIGIPEKKEGGPIVDPMGQWAHPGKVTRIPGSDITMKGVNYPVMGIGNNGMKQVMEPGGEYDFRDADYVDEYPMMKGGGYVVTRSNDRKGKTHKVTGPDGTVKYFGDSKLGQHPNDPERKKAFYARHKKNLAGNPYFRAFARKTWEEGGQTDDDREMLSGVADILRRINDTTNRKEVANHMMNNFRDEDVSFEPNAFLKSANVFGKGGEMIRRADGSYSKRGLWDNIRANKGSGKKPTKQMLEQERKIRSKQKGGEEVSIPQSLEELMNPTRRGAANVGFGFNNEKFAGNYNYSGADNFKNGTHALNFSLPTFMKTGSLDLSGTYSPGKSYSANVSGLTPANFIKKGATMNFSGGFEKDTTPMMKNVTPSYNVAAGFRIPTKVGNFTVNASYRK
jgi:hypothetical protein